MPRYLIFLLPLFACCTSNKNEHRNDVSNRTGNSVPKANTVVASDSMRLPDRLNELYYSVQVIATSESSKGVYEVLVTYGNNDASTQLTMPEAETPIIPEVRRGNEPFSYIIGFHHGTDTSFNDYYYIKAERGKTAMKYLKAYSFK